MPGISGLDLVRHVRENMRDTEVMMITGYPTIDGAVKAVKTGAEEYLTKPFTEEELFTAVRRVLDKQRIIKWHRASPSRPYRVCMASLANPNRCERFFVTLKKPRPLQPRY